MPPFLVAAFYKFIKLEKLPDLRSELLERARLAGIRGTILLASEGINGTIAGRAEAMQGFLSALRDDARFADLVHKESTAEEPPFLRMKVRLKKEIVTMGVPGTDPTRRVGTYVAPEDWNALILDPDVLVVDTRNDYEVAIGTFRNARNPKIKSFRDLPRWLDEQLTSNGEVDAAPGEPQKKTATKVAMFCTGGIRCEKSTAYLRAEGLAEVFHLDGGILRYLEKIPAAESLWEGQCFVFDQRVSVGHGLVIGDYELCRGCRRPLTVAERAHLDFREGVSCQYCVRETSPAQKEAFAEREKQMQLARLRGQEHLGDATPNERG